MSVSNPIQTINQLEALPHQASFWYDVESEEVALVGPYGTGKTLSLVIKCYLLKQLNGGLPDMLVSPTYAMARDILYPSVEEFLGEWLGIDVRIKQSSSAIIWPYDGWSPTFVRSAEKATRLKGPTLASVGIDEPGIVSDEAYKTAMSRIRHPRAIVRQGYHTGTPEGVIGWFPDKFADPKEPGLRTIHASTWHRTMRHYPAKLKSTYAGTPQMLKAYLEGMFVPLQEGRAHPTFDRTRHLREVFYDPSLPLILSCDFNVDQMRWVTWQLSPKKEIRVLETLVGNKNGSVPDCARAWVDHWSKRHEHLVEVTGDASGSSRSAATGSSCYDELIPILQSKFQTRFLVPPANPPIRDRVSTVNNRLSGEDGYQVMIDPSNEDLVKDFEGCTWDDLRKGDPRSPRSHTASAFSYGLWIKVPLDQGLEPVTGIPSSADYRNTLHIHGEEVRF